MVLSCTRLHAWVVTLIGAHALGTVARAQQPTAIESGADCVNEVQQTFDAGEFERAFEILSRCVPPSTRGERMNYLRIRGLVAYGLADIHPDAERIAREAFEELLRMDPTARLPEGASPRFSVFLERVRIESGAGRPEVDVRVLASTFGQVDFVLGGPVARADRPWIHFRAAGTSEYADRQLVCTSDSRCTTELPETLRSANAVEFYVEVLATAEERMHWLGGIGSAARPVLVMRGTEAQTTEPSNPTVEAPLWPWLVAGGGVLVAVVSVIVLIVSAPSDASFSCPSGQACQDLP